MHDGEIQAVVVLPEHTHCPWELPAGDRGYRTRWRQIKSVFSRALTVGERVSPGRRRRGVYPVDWTG